MVFLLWVGYDAIADLSDRFLTYRDSDVAWPWGRDFYQSSNPNRAGRTESIKGVTPEA